MLEIRLFRKFKWHQKYEFTVGTWICYPGQTQWSTVSAECEKFDSRCVETTLWQRRRQKWVSRKLHRLIRNGKNETSNWIPWDRMKQEGRASLHALQCKHRLCTLLSAATTTMLACRDLVGTTVPSVTLRYQSLQYTWDTFKFWREIGLCTVAMIWVRVARLGNVGLLYQRVNMIVLGLELSNTSQHLWPSVMGRLLCKCNWLQIEVTLLKMY